MIKTSSPPCYLVDENLSKSDEFLQAHPEFVNVKSVIHVGADDKVIIQKAVNEGLVLVTRDNGLALKALIAGVRVWYFDASDSGRDYKLYAQKFFS